MSNTLFSGSHFAHLIWNNPVLDEIIQYKVDDTLFSVKFYVRLIAHRTVQGRFTFSVLYHIDGLCKTFSHVPRLVLYNLNCTKHLFLNVFLLSFASSPMKGMKRQMIYPDIHAPHTKRYLTWNNLARCDDKSYKFRIRVTLKIVPLSSLLFSYSSFPE